MPPVTRRTSGNRSNAQTTSSNANAVEFPPPADHQLTGNGRLEVHLVFSAQDMAASSHSTYQPTNPLAGAAQSLSLVCHSCIRRSNGTSASDPIIIDDGNDEVGILENGQPCQNCIQNRNVRQRTLSAAEDRGEPSNLNMNDIDTFRVSGLDLNLPPPVSPSPPLSPFNPPPPPPPPLPTGGPCIVNLPPSSTHNPPPPPLPLPLPTGWPWIFNLPPSSTHNPPPPLPTGGQWYANVPLNTIPDVLDPASYRTLGPPFPYTFRGGVPGNVANMDEQDEDNGDYETDDGDDFELDLDNMTYEELLEVENTLGAVSTGLTEDQIKQGMRRFTYRIPRNTSCDEQCCICLDGFSNRDVVGQLDCKHQFHFECIKNWLVVKNICPICKRTAVGAQI